jgi:ABC-2 type transport system permease protein
MLNIYSLMFMMLPLIIPVTIAAYSIVGEKTTRSLEPILATPITTIELLIGKAASAVIPAIIASWLSFFIYIIGVRMLTNPTVFRYALEPTWLLATFLVGPLLAVFSVSGAVLISSRVSDPRAAEQLAGAVVLPIVLMILGQSMGWLLIDRTLILYMAGIVLVLDVVMSFITLQAFQRETILTRWK